MEIGAIARTVEQNIKEGGILLFSDETVGVPYIMLLFDTHRKQASSFELSGLVHSLQNDVFRMKGSAAFPDGTSCELELVFSNNEDGVLQVEMPGQIMMPGFGGSRFLGKCFYCEEEGAWDVTFSDTDSFRLADLISGAVSFLGIEVSPSVFGERGTISNLRFRYELPFEETGEDTFLMREADGYSDYNREKYFSLSFDTDMVLNLSALFQGGNRVALAVSSFLIEKFGGLYGFDFGGKIRIWELEVPFHIRYDGSSWTLGTFREDESVLEIPSVNRLGEIVGIGSLNLPDSFSNLSNFSFESVALSLSSDLRNFYSFNAVISNQNEWYLSRDPDIHITNLKAGFTKDENGTMVFIAGDFCLAGWNLALAGSYNDAGKNWIFRCFLSCMDMESANISEIFRKLCSFAGVGEIPFPLPDLPFRGAEFSYDMKARTFTASLQIGKMKGKFIYTFSQETSWQVKLEIDHEFALSGLPLVGTDLHLLDGMTIKDICLSADKTQSALSLNFAGNPLTLKFAGNQKEKEELEIIDAACAELPYPTLSEDRYQELMDDGSRNFLWFSLEKRFSVFTIHRLGLGFDGGKIVFALDAELASNAFQLSLDGLSLAVGISERPEVSFHLLGLTVGFQNPSLQISGGFRHIVAGHVSSYDGTLLISAKNLSVLAVGSYSDNSFLAYGMIKTKLGGPPAFSITGLAAGFGYNKYFALPDISQVGEHPLVRAAVDPFFSAGQLLDGLKSKAVTMPGQNFLAAGISFLSFGMVSSFVLLNVSFGQHLEVAVLGVSELTVPPMTKKNPIAKADLALKAAFLPETGVFSVEAQLMPDSYILSTDCRLAGGFALYAWFGGAHEGDFVITLGGYRRGYRKPAHYPDVPRLGFTWNVTRELKLSGELYFALTPSAVCAGGKLDAVFAMGALRAWFTAYVDLMLGWKPFYYDISVGIGLGFSITLDFWLFSKTFTLEMSVDLHIWGPEFSGTAKVKWWIISFTISFGAGAGRSDRIDWAEFRKSFLDGSGTRRIYQNAGRIMDGERRDERDGLTDTAGGQGIVSVKAVDGVIGKIVEEKAGKKAEIEVIHADSLRLAVESLIPVGAVSLNGSRMALKAGGTEIGVLPMGEDVMLQSELRIDITCSVGGYLTEEIRRNLPRAMWAKKKKRMWRNDGDGELIPNVLSGMEIRIKPKSYVMFPAGHFLTLAMLAEFQKITKAWVFASVWEIRTDGRDTGFAAFREKAPDIPGKAGALAAEMEKFGFSFDFTINVSMMADHAEELFDEEFVLA